MTQEIEIQDSHGEVHRGNAMTTLYRVADVDNFNGEGPSSTERFITEPINHEMAKYIATQLNGRYSGSHAPRYYRVVPEDYKLFIFEPRGDS